MSERFAVRVVKDHLVFCSGHFISYEGDKCERLHGHNYRTAVEVRGPLDDNQYVFDFIALKRLTREITDELDHRMLLPLHNPLIRVERLGPSIQVSYRDRRWVFPTDDCVLLPVGNTTAEELARYIGRRLSQLLLERHQFVPEELLVEVEEGPGQSAVYAWKPEINPLS